MCVLDCVVRIETGLWVIRLHYLCEKACIPNCSNLRPYDCIWTVALSCLRAINLTRDHSACMATWPAVGTGHWALTAHSSQFIDWGTVVQLPGRLPDQFLKVWRSFVWLVLRLRGQYGRPCQQQLGFLSVLFQVLTQFSWKKWPLQWKWWWNWVMFVLKTGRETTEDHLFRTFTARRCPAEGCIKTG